MDADNKKPFKIKDVTRNIKKAVVAGSLEEIRTKVAEKFERATEQPPTIHLDSDGTEIDDEEYFRTLDANTELIAVFPGEHWIDPTHYVTITSHRGEHADTTDAAAETARIKQLVGQLQNNLCNVSVMSDPDLDSLSNMDPNSLVDITGKDFMDQLKDSGRPLCAKRNAEDRINLLKLLKDGAIFCSERYPEDAEAIDMEISRQLNEATNNATTTTLNIGIVPNPATKTIELVQSEEVAMTAVDITVVEGRSSAAAAGVVAATTTTTANRTSATTTTTTNTIKAGTNTSTAAANNKTDDI